MRALCRKVHVCHCNSLGGATWRSITGRTDRRTDGQTECDAICGPPPREEGRIITHQRKVILGPFLLQFHFRRSTVILLPRCHANDTLCSSWLITVRFCFLKLLCRPMCMRLRVFTVSCLYTSSSRWREWQHEFVAVRHKNQRLLHCGPQGSQRLQKHTGTQGQC